jgi:hypothetical protein
MAPEQRESPSSVDHRADIYSLGVVLYEMLTGELPGTKLEPPSKKVQIDVRLDEIVLRALEQNPELRYQSAAELKTRVDTFVASGSAGPSPETAARVLMTGRGTVTTPERLATFWGSFFAHRRQGEFVLDERRLTIRHNRMLSQAPATVIPLNAIRDVAMGRYGALVNLIGLDYIIVTYDEAGQSRQVIFTPSPGIFESIAGLNQYVAEWCEVLRAARDGRTPRTVPRALSPSRLTSLPNGFFLMVVFMALFFVVFFVTSAIFRHRASLAANPELSPQIQERSVESP